MRRISKVLIACTLGLSLLGCAGTALQTPQRAYVEILRLRISKVRNAIEETRETISRSTGADYLPELYLRLAELLAEEARYHYRVAAERQQGSQESLHVPQVRLLKEQAIGLYEMVMRTYPETQLGDRILFNIGHEHRELGNFDEMRTALQRLVDDYTQSPFVGNSLLLLGDYHFDRSELPQAQGFYERITQGPVNAIAALAHFKLGWVAVNLGECPDALAAFDQALSISRQVYEPASETESASAENSSNEDSAQHVSQELDNAFSSIDVRRSALVDLVYCFSTEREATEAVPFLRARAYDRATYIAALESMARRFGVTDEAEGMIEVSRELLRLGPANEERLEDARSLHGALRAAQDYTQVDRDARLLTHVLTRVISRADQDQESRERLSSEFEVYVRDLLTRAQTAMEALPEDEQARPSEVVSRGYEVYLEQFPNVDNYNNIILNAGDTAQLGGRWFEAGQYALRAASQVASDERRREVLYDSVVRFQKALAPEYQLNDVTRRAVARAELRRAATSLLSYDLEPERMRRVRFAIAQTFYDGGRLGRAIDHLLAVAYEFPGTEESEASIRLVLDSYNTLNDYRGLLAAGRRMLEDGSPASASLQAEIRPIVDRAEQRMLDDISLDAAGDEGGDVSLLVEFAEQNVGTALGERALLNAFVAARAMGDAEQLYELGSDIRETYGESEQLPGMLATLGQMAAARYEIGRALDYLRQAADADHGQRGRLLTAMAEMHRQFGDTESAQPLYQEAARGADPLAAATPLSGLSAMVERTNDPRLVLSTLTPFEASGNSDVLARIGLAQLFADDTMTAESTLQIVLANEGSASPAAAARAHYGMAEILLRALAEYPALDDPMLVEEYVTVVDVIQQSYLNAARQGEAGITAASFGRLASMCRAAAERVESANLSASGLDSQTLQAIQEALDARINQLRQVADEAIEACSRQAWNSLQFTPAHRACLNGRALDETQIQFDSLQRRQPRSTPEGADSLRDRVYANSGDHEARRLLGELFLEAGDPHMARLVFAGDGESEPGPLASNLMGIASEQLGDSGAALRAFAIAARGGLESGRQNLITLLRRLGLQRAADAARDRFPEGRAGGALLPRGGGS